MQTYNVYLGAVSVSAHARKRWAERGTRSELLLDVLKRSVPFGGQFGNNMLLADGDVVFVTGCRKDGHRVVTTVLTMAQAVANMELAHGHQKHSSMPSPIAPIISIATDASNRKKTKPKESSTKSIGDVMLMYGLSDDDLMWEMSSASGMWLRLMERELGARKRLAKQIVHGKKRFSERVLLHKAIRTLFSEEQVQKIWDKVTELREAIPLAADTDHAET